MSIRKIALVAALGTSLASAPVVAQTSNLPEPARASASLDEADSQVRTTTGTYVIAFLALVAIGLGLYFAFIEDDDAPPVSP